jgi:phosphatidate cytidylyltransferase
MAFSWQTFKIRASTAAVFVVVMIAGLLTNRWTFLILFSVIHFGCWWEYLKLVEEIKKGTIHPFARFGLMLLGFGLMLSFSGRAFHFAELPIDLPLAAVIAGLIFLVTGIFARVKSDVTSLATGFLGVLYISLALGFMLDLYARTNSYVTGRLTTDIHVHDITFVLPAYFYPASIIASLWVNDTMAYIIGSLIGKTQMSKISPKKTWEGTIGGVILSGAVVFLLAYYAFRLGVISYALTIVAIIASVTGTMGDLFESKLKRMAGVKDSGRIMPGHGGFLDRFDSLLVATPAVWLFVYFLMK